jgi:hypothetical protein
VSGKQERPIFRFRKVTLMMRISKGSMVAFSRPRFSPLVAFILVAVTLGTSHTPGTGAEPAAGLVGLWHTQRDYGPEVK